MPVTQTATFLFTDIVGSTALSTSVTPEEADEVRRAHFQLLRGAVDATGGVEVKGLGDGLMVMFSSASRALACAAAMQQAVERDNRRHNRELGLRIGVAVGEATEEEGDFFGDAVVEAARLCAAAAGGQIITTEALRIIVGRHATHTLRSLGTLELKGLPDPVSTVEVVWEPNPLDNVPLPARLVGATPEATFGFVGRTGEIAHIEHAFKQALSSSTLQVVLLGGEPGIGKTALAAHTARKAHEIGAAVSFGPCEEGLGVAFHPWLSALAHLIEHGDSETTDRIRDVHVTALRRLLPQLTDRLPAGEEVTADADAERYLLLDAVASLISETAASSGLMVVLDDLQWADVASLQVLSHLIRSPAPARALIVGTFRPGDLGSGHPLAGLLADLRSEPRVTRHDLSGLGDDEVVSLIESAAGHELDAAGTGVAHAIRRETAGNPFFLVELLRHLGETGSIVQDSQGRYGLRGGLSDLALPASIREVVVRRVGRLGEDAQRILSVASVIGLEFDLEVVCSMVDDDEDAVLDLLDASVGAAVVIDVDDPPGRYRFAHALVQSTLYSDMSAARRQRTHQRAAAFFEERNLPGDATAVAHHLLAAVRPADVDKAVEYALRAGNEALSALAPLDSAHWYRRGLDAFERSSSPDSRRRAELLVALAEAEVLARAPGYRATVHEASAAAVDCNDTDLIVRAALVRTPGSIDTAADADPETTKRIELALERVGPADSPVRARLLAALSEEHGVGNPADCAALATAALETADRLGDAETLLRVYAQCASGIRLADRAEQRRAWAARVKPLLKDTNDLSLGYWVLDHSFENAADVLDWVDMDRILAELDERAATVGLDLFQWEPLMLRAWAELTRGRLSEGERLANEAMEVGLRAGLSPTMASYGAQLMMHRMFSGRLEEILDVAAVAEPPLETVAVGWRLAVMWLHLQAGRTERARELWEESRPDVAKVPYDSVWLQSIALLGDSATAFGHLDLVTQCYELLSPHRESFWFSGSHDIGYLARYLGKMAHVLGQNGLAEEHLRYALKMHKEKGLPYYEARSALDLAELIRTTDQHEAAALLDRAGALAEQFGFGGLPNPE